MVSVEWLLPLPRQLVVGVAGLLSHFWFPHPIYLPENFDTLNNFILGILEDFLYGMKLSYLTSNVLYKAYFIAQCNTYLRKLTEYLFQHFVSKNNLF